MIFLVLNVASSIIISTDNFFSKQLTWYRVLNRIHKSKRKIDSKTMYLGDSVGGQIFPPKKLKNSLTSNKFITLSGQYFLIKNLINSNPQIDSIIIVISPFSIGIPFETTNTVHDIAKPFFTFSNFKEIRKSASKTLSKAPFLYLYFFPYVKLLPISEPDISRYNTSKEFMSVHSIYYLNKICELCKCNDIDLFFVSPPVSEKMMSNRFSNIDINDISGLSQEAYNELRGYLRTITYVNEDIFRDEFHYKYKYVNIHRKDMQVAIIKSL